MKNCENCKHAAKGAHENPCYYCTNASAWEAPKKAAKKADKTDLCRLTIELQEIEDPEKGRGCTCRVDGKSSAIAAAKMFLVMFQALEREYPEAFIPAMSAFMMEDLSEEDFMKILR